MKEFEACYSANAINMKKSVIRELLKLTARPEIISFAGGLPAPETFPVADLKEAAALVFDKHAAKALQYGTTEGDPDLKEEIIKFESRQGVQLDAKNLLVVSASQQALDMVAKVFLDPGDYVIAGRPTYVGAIQAIQSYSAKVLGIPFTAEQDGFDMAILERSYQLAVGAGKKLKYIYVIPDFQNPAGFCWSLAKRQALLQFAYTNSLIIIEDSPYREIRFIGEHIPSIYQLDQQGANRGIVVNLKTFSKILVPGARVGWIMAHEELINKFVIAKQAMDLCTNVFTQKWLAEYMKTGKLYDVIKSTCANYCEKRNLMVQALEKYMPKRWEIQWTKPEGGLFLWLSLPKFINTDDLIYRAVEEEKVAYVISSAFYFDDPEKNAMRLNFSYSSPELIEEGIKRLARIITREIENYEKGHRAQTSPEGL
ncbi:MAG: PLP-dependent aminotransferase family protein [Spirochaetes bacterium]|nr:PLP-dependent aminotransferase family protein [Spirochaetota bacterium]MBU0954664.1 PLP-dependent aminotransferase family protein [Spirochaetota bacterium]